MMSSRKYVPLVVLWMLLQVTTNAFVVPSSTTTTPSSSASASASSQGKKNASEFTRTTDGDINNKFSRHIGLASTTTAAAAAAELIPTVVEGVNTVFPPIVDTVPVAATSITIAIIFALGHILAGNIIGIPVVGKARTMWYDLISKPKWTPSNKLAAFIATFVYICNGIAASFIYRGVTKAATTAATSSSGNIVLLNLWLSHVTLNILWQIAFYGKQMFRFGLGINITLLTSLITVIVPNFFQINPIAGYLLVPYGIWLVFATKLNQMICHLNPTDKNGKNEAHYHIDLIKTRWIVLGRPGTKKR